ncbi:AMP-binding protein [Aeromicrobium sp. 636]|uniref:AMP-binding protein n=1 Tax=Aeromicrobium senzhongii TaxID=2663859 RepID=A0A8I0ERN9_9ACTN|nr:MULTISPECIES: AMP-binding protein [Aeromicrobium]MBC9224744.1 AMP-binding protein [Aeromicrobium senzhongii]MCQ3996857.1 AMP-binding protein [Aeromicrobium sp. 636]
MARPHSVAFRALDLNVIRGRADDSALVTPTGTLSYAQLLHESASLAGGLRELGLRAGVPVHLDVPDRHVWVVSVLAIVRLGAEPDERASFTITGDPAVINVGGEEYELDLVLRAGRVDPAAAEVHDSGDYGERMERRFGDVLATLLHGGTLT